MPYMIVRHTVADFPKFKAAFDEHAGMRREFGSRGGMVFQGTNDPHEVVVVLEWKDAASAKDFAESATLREAMAGAGVTGAPQIFFVNKIGDVQV